MAELKIARGLQLPIDVITLATAVLGIRGSGKTNTGVVIAEELLDAGHQIVVIDPLDVWWGLRSSADGKRDGYPITVLGGVHGDVPLSETDGKVVADFVVENRIPAILSMRHLSKSSQRRLVADFAEQVYRRKGEQGRNTPCLFMVDEASSFCPQRVDAGEARMVGAIEDWVRRGRASGIGAMLIDQRAATVNKDVLTQIEMLVCHRTTSPQDRAALKLWIQSHDTAGKESEFMASLASLVTGEAWFWSPAWLDLFKRVQVRPRRTFDSSATPKSGQVAAPRKVAEVDLQRLKVQLQVTIERAKADDPRELKRQITELKKQLASKQPVADEGAVSRAVAKSVAESKRRWSAEVRQRDKQLDDLRQRMRKIVEWAGGTSGSTVSTPPVRKTPVEARPSRVKQPRVVSPQRQVENPDVRIGKGERAILVAVAQHAEGVSREQLTVLTGYKRSSRDVYIQRLRQAGLVEDAGGTITATEEGLSALPADFEPLPTGEALQAHWLRPGRLPEGERVVLELLVARYPDSMPREEIDELSGYKRSSRDAYLQRLRARKLVVAAGRGAVTASDHLF